MAKFGMRWSITNITGAATPDPDEKFLADRTSTLEISYVQADIRIQRFSSDSNVSIKFDPIHQHMCGVIH